MSIEDSSEVPQVWRLRSEGSWTSHNGSSVNFLGDGTIFWGDGTATLQDAIKSGNVSSRVNQFFNSSALVPATLIHAGGVIDGQFPVDGDGTIFGSLGRNILRGPDQHNFDSALIKRTKITEQVGIVFRWEVLNVLNHPNFANPASNVSSASTFGKISAMSVNPRIMQYALKLEF